MPYGVPVAVLVLTLVAFFVLGHGKFAPFGRVQSMLRLVVALPLALSSIGHFIRTSLFASMIPPVFPCANFWSYLLVLEMAGAIGLLFPATARWAATCLALLMIAVFPANVYMAHYNVGGLHMPSVRHARQCR
jgi:uncharacterized membrane protein